MRTILRLGVFLLQQDYRFSAVVALAAYRGRWMGGGAA
jgi:hypothetical protein